MCGDRTNRRGRGASPAANVHGAHIRLRGSELRALSARLAGMKAGAGRTAYWLEPKNAIVAIMRSMTALFSS
jgi:hypothetical protein